MKDSENTLTLGARMKWARGRAGLTQQQVASHFGLSVQAVSQWERDVHAPELARAFELATLLGVQAAWLASGIGEPYYADPRDRDHLPLVPGPGSTDQENFATLPIEPSRKYGRGAFAIVAPDDANSPVINKGDVLIADPDATPYVGDFVVCIPSARAANSGDETEGQEWIVRRLGLFSDDTGAEVQPFALVPLNAGYPTYLYRRHRPLPAWLAKSSLVIIGALPVVEFRKYRPQKSEGGQDKV